MEEIIFKPRYTFSLWFEIFIRLFWAFIAGGIFLQGGRLSFWWLLLFVILTGTLFFFIVNIVKGIIFRQNALVIEYFLHPRREIEYQEISDIGEKAIWAGKFHLSTADYSNRTELLPITHDLLKSGRITQGRLEGKLKKTEEMTKTAAVISFFGTMIVVVIMGVIWPIWFSTIEFEFWTIVELSFLGVFVLTLIILKILAARERQP